MFHHSGNTEFKKKKTLEQKAQVVNGLFSSQKHGPINSPNFLSLVLI